MNLSILLIPLALLPTIIHGIAVSKIGSCHHIDINGERGCIHVVPKVTGSYSEVYGECESVEGSLPKINSETELLALKRILYWHGFGSDSFYVYWNIPSDLINETTKLTPSDRPILNVKDNTIKNSFGNKKLPIVCFRPFTPKVKCNNGFLMYQKTGSCFKGFTYKDRADGKGYNASECQQHCVSLKSQMAVFDSKEELNFVFAHITEREETCNPRPRVEHCIGYWTGHRLPAKDAPGVDCKGGKLASCVFNMDGSEYTLRNGDQWAPGEPNARQFTNERGEHCVEIYTGHTHPRLARKWNDLACVLENGCLCRHQADRT